MKADATSTLLAPPPSREPDWNWRAELATLESKLEHVAGGERWDWRQDLNALEGELDQLAQRLGLPR